MELPKSVRKGTQLFLSPISIGRDSKYFLQTEKLKCSIHRIELKYKQIICIMICVFFFYFLWEGFNFDAS